MLSPQWSPNGDRILFASFHQNPATSANTKETGSVTLRIYSTATGNIEPVKDSAGRFNQRWWPGGRSLIATDAGMTKLLRHDVSSQNWRVVLHEHVDWPSWSADGRFLFFECQQGYEHGMGRWRVGDPATETVARFQNISRVRGEFGRWFGVDPAGSPMVLRDARYLQIFALDWPGTLQGRVPNERP